MAEPGTGPLADLIRLLAAERESLLSGDLAALAALIETKGRLLAAVEAGRPAPPAADLERLRTLAAANQTLIEAALQGVKAARARLEIARAGGPALQTYDAAGRAERHSPPRPQVERRA